MTAPVPRDTADPLVSARDAVVQVHQLVAGDDHQAVVELGRARQLARWHSDDQSTDQRGHDCDAQFTSGGAA